MKWKQWLNSGEEFKVYVLISFKYRLRYLKSKCKNEMHNSNS